MARTWTLIVVLLYAFMQKGMSATSNEGNSNTGMQSNTQSESSIPDLNVPLVEEASKEQSASHMTSTDKISTKYSSKVKYHSRKGGLAEFRQKERERLKRYRSGLTEEERKSQTKKVLLRREEKKKADSNFRESIRKAAREEYHRRKGRKLAEKEGKPIKPEHAKRKPGRKIKPLPPDN